MNANPFLCPSWHNAPPSQTSATSPDETVRPARPLPDGSVLTLDAKLIDALRDDLLPLLVDFWAPWCAPCKRMAPAFAEAALLLAPGVRLGKVNTEQERGVGKRFRVQSIPTLVLFQGGRELARISGTRPAAEIVAWTRNQLSV